MSADEHSMSGPLPAALTAILDQQPNGAIIEVDALESELEDYQRYEIVRALKYVQAKGGGTFIAGRRGQPSRFLINKSWVYGSPAEESGGAGASSQAEPEHVLIFRRSPTRSLALPANLTAEEVERIVRWVQALPTE